MCWDNNILDFGWHRGHSWLSWICLSVIIILISLSLPRGLLSHCPRSTRQDKESYGVFAIVWWIVLLGIVSPKETCPCRPLLTYMYWINNCFSYTNEPNTNGHRGPIHT